MADSSFDIVSKIDRQEVDNALGQTAREIATRFDFKGTGATIEWQGDEAIEISASADDRATAVLDVFKDKLIKRQQSLKILDASRAPAVRPGVQDRDRAQGGHHLRGRQEDLQADPRRGPQGRQGADPGRRAAHLVEEARRPAGRAGAGQGARTTTSRCSSRTTADGSSASRGAGSAMRRSDPDQPVEAVTAATASWRPTAAGAPRRGRRSRGRAGGRGCGSGRP